MNRRDLFVKGSLLAAGAVAGRVSIAPLRAAESGKKTFLFVHGAWHAATHWNKVTERLSQLGHSAIAIDLPGSGLNALYPKSYLANDWNALVTEPSPVKDIGLKDYADAVTPVVQKIAASGSKVTLVGHSFGGLTITLVGERAPESIERLVYLTAYCPTKLEGGSAAAYNSLPENKISKSGDIQFGDPGKTGGVRINPRNGDPDYLEKGRQAFYNDVPMEEFVKFALYLNPDLSLKAALEDARGTPGRWGKIPRTFIRCTIDHAIPIALQDRMIKEADEFTPDNKFDIKTLESSHSSFASMPDKLAETLGSLA